jgi:hypothetical protein
VEFSVVGGNLHLNVDGTEYGNITSAIAGLAEYLTFGSSTGSNDDGNNTNNVIGNRAIRRHVVFGNTTLEQIVGHYIDGRIKAVSDRVVNKPYAKTRSIVKIDNRPAKEAFYAEGNTFADLQALRAKFGKETVDTAFTVLFWTEFQLRFGM